MKSQKTKDIRETKKMIEAIKDKKGWKPSLFFFHQIIDFASTYFTSFILAYFVPA